MTANRETLGFTTQTRQILQLMIHSLYSNREIFLRELISNASDALDKLRLESYRETDLMQGDAELRIDVTCDPDAGTVTVRDNGIGMSREEVISNIGTIAKSGTAEFLEGLKSRQSAAEQNSLIGQFGVGFYSSFIVADQVELRTRKAGAPADQGVLWRSDGGGEYSIEPVALPERGTEIVLYLKQDAKEFADPHRLRSIIHRYSEHITFPVRMPKPDEEGDTPDEAQEQTSSAAEFEVVNQATALWTRPRKEITQQEYDEFYKQICFDFEPPLLHLHSRVEGKQEYTSLLYVPSRAPFDLWDRDRRHGVKLYVKRVFIMDDAEQLMPAYLRFVRGVIDSDDLPLNVSREILQGNRLVDSIRAGCTRKVLDALSEMAEQDAEKYAKFWTTFGRVIKEGVVEDPANRERIAALLRFVTTDTGPDGMTSLQTYIENMPEGQEKIYYLTADSYAAAAESPHLEIFRQRNIEVLLLSDPIDEWVVDGLAEFEGKSLQSVAKGELDIDNLGDDDARDAPTAEQTSELTERLQGVLEDRVESVRVTRRLTQSPVCLVVGEHAMSKHLERIMQAAGQNLPGSKPILEVNAEHPLVQRAAEEKDDERFADWAALLLDQALLSEGGQLDNPAAFLRRVNRFLTERQEEASIIPPS